MENPNTPYRSARKRFDFATGGSLKAQIKEIK